MAKEKEDVLQANAGGPAADIPDLKKKEKERKKAGAAWGGARGAASEFSGATGGNAARAAASAAGAMGEGAAELVGAESGGFFSGIARFFASIAESLGMGEFWASMMSSMLGRMAVAAAAFLMVAAAGLLGYALLKGKGSDALGTPDLGGIADSMRVRAGGDDRLGGTKGDIRFDPLAAAKPAAAPPVTDVKAADPTPAPAKADAAADKPVPSGLLAHNMSGTSLSSSLGGGFGSNNIFAGNSNAPKFGSGASGIGKGGAGGHLSSMKASTTHATPSARSVGKGSANKAFGQLRLAKGLSQAGAGATSAEQAAASAQGAFDQQAPTGGGLATTGAPGGDSVASPSSSGGAPDTSVPAACSGATCNPTGAYTDPGLDSSLKAISDMANKAMNDVMQGTIKEVLGLVLIAIGVTLLFWPCTAWGLALIAAGGLLYANGSSQVDQGHAEEAQAIAMGTALASKLDNQQQGGAVQYCTQWAVQTGKPVSECVPPDSVTNNDNQSAQDAADISKVKAIPVGTATIAP